MHLAVYVCSIELARNFSLACRVRKPRMRCQNISKGPVNFVDFRRIYALQEGGSARCLQIFKILPGAQAPVAAVLHNHFPRDRGVVVEAAAAAIPVAVVRPLFHYVSPPSVSTVMMAATAATDVATAATSAAADLLAPVAREMPVELEAPVAPVTPPVERIRGRLCA